MSDTTTQRAALMHGAPMRHVAPLPASLDYHHAGAFTPNHVVVALAASHRAALARHEAATNGHDWHALTAANLRAALTTRFDSRVMHGPVTRQS